MKTLFILVVIMIPIIFLYTKYIVKRIYELKFKKDKKGKIIIMLISLLITLISMNVFKCYGVFTLYVLTLSAFQDLIFKIIKEKKKIKIIHYSLIIPILITIGLFIYGNINIDNIVRTEYTINSSKLNNNYKIGVISDSHYNTVLTKENLYKIKDKLNTENLDFLLLAGDIVDESTSKEKLEEIFKVLGEVKTNKGIYYTYGNHDKQSYKISKKYSENELESIIKTNNIKILEDNYEEFEDIYIIGRNDLSNKNRKKIEEIYNEINKEKFLLVMDHQPNEYNKNNINGTDLIISGHTHGGQLFPLSIIINLTKSSDMAYGYKRIENMHAIVTSGIAGWGYRVRTEGHSEYVIVNLLTNK